MSAYYNEIDPFAAAWLRELIKQGHIAPGFVDERSIEDVSPNELAGYTQCHFFAGIGGWSLALRRAGWQDTRPVWTGSCPCQPFSAAGKGAGFNDERHLWPAFQHLISQQKPPIVFGEQVASKAVDDWIDLVHADMEALGYAFGSVPFPSAGVGAPHIRDRNYWVADSMHTGRAERRASAGIGSFAGSCVAGGLGNNNNKGLEGLGIGHQAEGGRVGAVRPITEAGEFGGMAYNKLQQRQNREPGIRIEHEEAGLFGDSGRPGQTNGPWRDADWLFCRDGKWRPVEPGTFPLAHGIPARVGRLRGYGNAINSEAAQAFIESWMRI